MTYRRLRRKAGELAGRALRRLGYFRRFSPNRFRGARSARVAEVDARIAAQSTQRRFSLGQRPVIRWIKGDGRDDEITRAAIGQATRLFGNAVDYCLCTTEIGAERVRSLLAWAEAPVEWWPLCAEDNPDLAAKLAAVDCAPPAYGYWWKWFPERVRPDAPEWILDGDMVITRAPSWFRAWSRGRDFCRITHDSPTSPYQEIYGNFQPLVPAGMRPYSGLISLAPGQRYLPDMLRLLEQHPLRRKHDGRHDMDEQGVIAAAFGQVGRAIPLHEFPFARAFEDKVDHGAEGDQGTGWGYHFGFAFRQENPHFNRLVAAGEIYSRATPPSAVEQFAWLGGQGQWGVPGWSMTSGATAFIVERARAFAGRQVLELGTSRGRLSAMLATVGCRLTTVDHQDRGAAQNLRGLDVKVVTAEATQFLATAEGVFDLIVVDVHGNTEAQWRKLGPLLERVLSPRGTLIISNAQLWKIPEWFAETGVRWYLNSLPSDWRIEMHADPEPGVAIVSRAA